MVTLSSWLVMGLIAGCLAGLLLGKDSDVVATTMLGMIGGMAGGCVSLVLFMVSGAVQGIPPAILVVAFALFLIAMSRVFARATTV